jgi:hypothetical protein
MDKIYPDTEEGALQFLKDAFETPTPIEEPITVLPDPQVNGVWKIKTKEFEAIVYLKGHKTPFEEIREYKDIEIIEFDT